jgi:hypothetical protein
MDNFLQTAKEFTINHFSAIVLSIGLLLIVSNTIDISVNRNAEDKKDKLNTYFGLNVSGLVFIGLYLSNEYIFPVLVNKGSL